MLLCHHENIASNVSPWPKEGIIIISINHINRWTIIWVFLSIWYSQTKEFWFILCAFVSITGFLNYNMYVYSFSTHIGALQLIRREKEYLRIYSRQRSGFMGMVMMKLKTHMPWNCRILKKWVIIWISMFALLFFIPVWFLLVSCSWWIQLRIDIKMEKLELKLKEYYYNWLLSSELLLSHFQLRKKNLYDYSCVIVTVIFLWSFSLCLTFSIFQVINECFKAEKWLREKTQLQDSLPKNTDPVLWSTDIRNRTEELKLYYSCAFTLHIRKVRFLLIRR